MEIRPGARFRSLCAAGLSLALPCCNDVESKIGTVFGSQGGATERGGAGSVAGSASAGAGTASGGTSGGAAPDGGRSGADGGTASKSNGSGGAAEATGGAAEATGGASTGGNSGGVGGGSGVGADAGAAGESGGVGGGVAAPAYFRAGTRLKPRVLRGGGLEVLDGIGETSWFDVGTGERCAFRLGADGVERCFPDTLVQSTYYSDAACTKPVFIDRKQGCGGSPAPYHYVTIGTADTPNWACGGTTYRLGPPLAVSTQIYGNAADSCQPEPVAAADTVLQLEKVPLDTFVAVQRVSRPRLPNMNAWVREGADGSSEVVGFYDPARQAPCSGLGVGISSDACVPSWVELRDTFADAGCTQRVGLDDPSVCRSPTSTAFLELESQNDSCNSTTSIRGIWQVAGTRRTQIFDSISSNGSCQPSSLPVSTAYLQGPPIDVASLPKLDVILVGQGALRLPFYGFDDVPFFPAPGGSFVEAASGDSCDVRLFADGTWRCVRSAFRRLTEMDVLYQSADCTGERLYTWRPLEGCPGTNPEPSGITLESFTGECGEYPWEFVVHPVSDTFEFEGPPPTRSQLFHTTPFSPCQSFVEPDDRTQIFRVTKQVNPADRFIPLEKKLSD